MKVSTFIMGKMKVRTFIMGKMKVRTLILALSKVRESLLFIKKTVTPEPYGSNSKTSRIKLQDLKICC